MCAKITSVDYATKRGIETLIGNGEKKGTITKAIGGNFPGTKFLAKRKNNTKKHEY